MSLRLLFAILIAFAMTFAPLAILGGSAMAMAPATDHHETMMQSGHCAEQPAQDTGDKSEDKSCCVAMCTAIAVAPVVPIEPHALASSIEPPSLIQFNRSILAELPTPPPRIA